MVLKPENLDLVLHLFALRDIDDPGLKTLLGEAYEDDPKWRDILKALRNGDCHYKDITLALCRDQDGLLYYDNRLYVPESAALKLYLL